MLSLPRGKNLSPLDFIAAERVVAPIHSTAQKLWNVDLRLWPTFASMPADVKEAVAKYGENTKAKGVFHKGVIHMVADAHVSEVDLETTILHEIKGHVAIRRLYGQDITNKLNALFILIGGRKGLGAIAARRGLTADLTDYAKMLGQSEFTDEMRMHIMMEEALAHIVQKPKLGDRVKAIVGAIRDWLRRHDFAKLAEYGETDLLHILSKASKALPTNQTNDGPAVLNVSRQETPTAAAKLNRYREKRGLLDAAIRAQ